MRPIRGFIQNAADWEEALSRASMAREWIDKQHVGNRESFAVQYWDKFEKRIKPMGGQLSDICWL